VRVSFANCRSLPLWRPEILEQSRSFNSSVKAGSTFLNELLLLIVYLLINRLNFNNDLQYSLKPSSVIRKEQRSVIPRQRLSLRVSFFFNLQFFVFGERIFNKSARSEKTKACLFDIKLSVCCQSGKQLGARGFQINEGDHFLFLLELIIKIYPRL